MDKKRIIGRTGDECEHCGQNTWDVSRTLIQCVSCGVAHRCIGGYWQTDKATIPTEKPKKESISKALNQGSLF